MKEQSLFPIIQFDQELWKQKVECTLMTTISSEKQAQHVLIQINQILERLMDQEIGATLGEQAVPFFFNFVFQEVAANMIKSKSFNNTNIYCLFYSILNNILTVFQKHFTTGKKYPNFLKLLPTIFSSEEQVFTSNESSNLHVIKQNMQPWTYYSSIEDFPLQQRQKLQIGDFVDALKIDEKTKKVMWCPAKIMMKDGKKIGIAFFDIATSLIEIIGKQSPRIAKYKSRQGDLDWRYHIEAGTKIEFYREGNNWVIGTVKEIIKNKTWVQIIVQESNIDINDSKSYSFDRLSPRIQKLGTIIPEGSLNFCPSLITLNSDQCFSKKEQHILIWPSSLSKNSCLLEMIKQLWRSQCLQNLKKEAQETMNLNLLQIILETINNISKVIHAGVIKEFVQFSETMLQKILHSRVWKDDPSALVHLLQNTKSLKESLGKREEDSRIYTSSLLQIAAIMKQSTKQIDQLTFLQILKKIFDSAPSSVQGLKMVKQWAINSEIFSFIIPFLSCSQKCLIFETIFQFYDKHGLLTNQNLEKFYDSIGDYPESFRTKYQYLCDFFKSAQESHLNLLLTKIKGKDFLLIQDMKILTEAFLYNESIYSENIYTFLTSRIFDEMNSQQSVQLLEEFQKMMQRIQNDELRAILLKILVKQLKGDPEELCFQRRIQTFKKILKTKKKKGSTDIQETVSIDLIQNCTNKIQELSIQNLKKYYELIENLARQISCRNLSASFFLGVILRLFQVKDPQIYKFLNEKCGNISKFYSVQAKIINKMCEQIDFEQINQEQAQVFLKLLQRANFSCGNFIEKNKIKYRTVPTDNIIGFSQMQHLLLSTSNNQIQKLMMDVYLQIFKNNLSNENRLKCLQKYLNQLNSLVKQEKFEKAFIIMEVIDIIIGQSEIQLKPTIIEKSRYLRCGKKTIEFKILGVNQQTKNIQIPLNYPVRELKKMIAQISEVQEETVTVMIFGRMLTQFEDYKMLLELDIDDEVNVTIGFSGKKPNIQAMHENNLVIDGEVNPAAVSCLQTIFKEFSEEGQMKQEHVNNFIKACLGTEDEIRMRQFMNDNDPEKKGYVSESSFKQFYLNACPKKPQTVITNFVNIGVKGYYSYKQDKQIHIPLRDYLSKNEQFLQNMQILLEKQSTSLAAYLLINRIQINQDDLSKTQTTLPQILSGIEKYPAYKRLYFLTLIDYLLVHDQDQDKISCFQDSLRVPGEIQKLLEVSKAIFEETLCFRSFLQITLIYQILLFLSTRNLCNKNKTIIDKIMRKQAISEISAQFTAFEPEDAQIQKQIYSENSQILRYLGIVVLYQEKMNQSIITSYQYKQALRTLFTALSLHFFINPKSPNFRQLIMSPHNQSSHESFHSNLIYCIISQIVLNQQKTLFLTNLQEIIWTNKNHQAYKVIYQILYQFIRQNSLKKVDAIVFSDNFVLFTLNVILKNQEKSHIFKCAYILQSLPITNFENSRVPGLALKIWENCLKNQYHNSSIDQEIVYIYKLLQIILNAHKSLTCDFVTKMKENFSNKLEFLTENSVQKVIDLGVRSYGDSTGIQNLGSLGYMNSVLYLLYSTRKLRNFILTAQLNDDEEFSRQKAVVKRLKKLFLILHYTKDGIYDPKELINELSVILGDIDFAIQRDAQQFLIELLQIIERALKDPKSLQKLLYGKMKKRIKCSHCERQRIIFDQFNHLILNSVSDKKTLELTLSQNVFQREQISCFCESCGSNESHSVQTTLQETPQIFMFHINAIFYNYLEVKIEKQSLNFKFPQDSQKIVDLSEHCNPLKKVDQSYRLIGQIIHDGDSEVGHYLFYSKEGTNWMKYDDLNVCSLQESPFSSFDNTAQCATFLVYENIAEQQHPENEFWDSIESSESLREQIKTIIANQELRNMITLLLKDEFRALFLKLFQMNSQDCKIFEFCLQITFKVWIKPSIFSYVLGVISQSYSSLPQESKFTFMKQIYPIFKKFREKIEGMMKKHHKSQRYAAISLINRMLPQLIDHEQKSGEKDLLLSHFLKRLDSHMFISEEQVNLWTELVNQKPLIEYYRPKQFILSALLSHLQKISSYRQGEQVFYEPFTLLQSQKQKIIGYLITLINQSIDGSQIQKLALQNLDYILEDHLSSINGALIKRLCLHNQQISRKVAEYLLKKLKQQDVNTLLSIKLVIEEFLSLRDNFSLQRIKWILGQRKLLIETILNSQGLIDSLEFRYSKYASSLSTQSCLLEQTILLRFSNQSYVFLCIAIISKISVRSRQIKKYLDFLDSPVIQFTSFYALWENLLLQLENDFFEEKRLIQVYQQTKISFPALKPKAQTKIKIYIGFQEGEKPNSKKLSYIQVPEQIIRRAFREFIGGFTYEEVCSMANQCSKLIEQVEFEREEIEVVTDKILKQRKQI